MNRCLLPPPVNYLADEDPNSNCFVPCDYYRSFFSPGDIWINNETGQQFIFTHCEWEPITCCATGSDVTAENIGGAQEIFKQKVGDILELRTLTAASNRISVVQVGDVIEFDVDSSNFSAVNDDFACTRSGEAVDIDVVANDFNVDNSTVTITQNPEHNFGALVVGGTGIVTYTADTRYLGSDFFAYEVKDTLGNTILHRGTVHIDIVSEPPVATAGTTAIPRFIYSRPDGGGTADRGVYQYNNGIETLIFIPGGTRLANALATNRDDNLIYYAEDESMYGYDYINNIEFTIVADITTDPKWTLANSFNTGVISLNDGGATYYNGIYYICGSGNATGYYRVVLQQYIPGSGAQEVLDVHFVLFSDNLTRDMGGVGFNFNGYNLMFSTGGSASTASFTISTVDPDSGDVLRAVTIGPGNLTYQIAWGVDSIIWVSNSAEVMSVNTNNGAVSAAFPNDLVEPALDLAMWISQPC